MYDVPESKSQRSASFGYGKKMDLGKEYFQKPSPDNYNMPSDFIKNKNKGITISAGREIVKVNSVFSSNKMVPGPG